LIFSTDFSIIEAQGCVIGMKTKLLNIAAISCIALATLLAFGWAGVELAIYYGNNTLYSNMFFFVVLRKPRLLWIFIA
jgi:hypothetical protein